MGRVIGQNWLSTSTSPFQVLRVPIDPIKLNKNGCHVLLNKMSARLRDWSLKRLTFADKLELSVLKGIHAH